MASIAWDRQVEVAVTKIDGMDGAYSVNMCNYAKVLSETSGESSVK
jgi:hypothetical protein